MVPKMLSVLLLFNQITNGINSLDEIVLFFSSFYNNGWISPTNLFLFPESNFLGDIFHPIIKIKIISIWFTFLFFDLNNKLVFATFFLIRCKILKIYFPFIELHVCQAKTNTLKKTIKLGHKFSIYKPVRRLITITTKKWI